MVSISWMAFFQVDWSSQSKGRSPLLEPMYTGHSICCNLATTRLPVLPLPPKTNVFALLFCFVFIVSNFYQNYACRRCRNRTKPTRARAGDSYRVPDTGYKMPFKDRLSTYFVYI